MAEATVLGLSEGEQDPTNPNHFQLDVEISGLPYVFEGVTPDEPGAFDLVVRLPDDRWQAVSPQVDASVADNPHYASQYRRLQQGLHLGDGRVGSVWVKEADAQDGAPSIGVSRIQTDNLYLPEDSEYYKAKGTGSFILDNLCALADVRGWRIYLEPLERDGRLTGADLVAWYEKRGFDSQATETEGMASTSGSMMRLPQQADKSQPITQLLKH